MLMKRTVNSGPLSGPPVLTDRLPSGPDNLPQGPHVLPVRRRLWNRLGPDQNGYEPRGVGVGLLPVHGCEDENGIFTVFEHVLKDSAVF
jgi:hypothetical protein